MSHSDGVGGSDGPSQQSEYSGRNKNVDWGCSDRLAVSGARSTRIRTTFAATSSEVAKLIHLAHADEDAITATPATDDDLRLIGALPDCPERRAILCIRFTGPRLADLRRLRRKQFAMSPSQVKIEVRITKNRRVRRYPCRPLRRFGQWQKTAGSEWN